MNLSAFVLETPISVYHELPRSIGLKRIKRRSNWKPNKRKNVWEYYTTGKCEVGKTVQYAEQGIPAYNELVI